MMVGTAFGQLIDNGQWAIDRIDDEKVTITGPDKATARFGMVFRVFLSTENPKPAKAEVAEVRYVGATSWVASKPDPDSGIADRENKDWGDGFDPGIGQQDFLHVPRRRIPCHHRLHIRL